MRHQRLVLMSVLAVVAVIIGGTPAAARPSQIDVDSASASVTDEPGLGSEDQNRAAALLSDDDDGDGIPNSEDDCPLIPEDFDGEDDSDGCPDTDVGVEKDIDEEYDVDVSEDVTKTVDVTVTNGNYDADVLVHVLTVSPFGEQCQAELLPKPGWERPWIPCDEDGDTLYDTLYTELMRTVSLGAGASFNDTVSYTVHCSERSQHTFELQVDALPLSPVEEEDVEDLPNVEKDYPTITAWDIADLKKVSTEAAAPASVVAGVPFDVTVTQTIHNNGYTDPVDAEDVVTMVAPPDCAIAPSGGNMESQTEALSQMAASVPVTFDTTFSVTCSDPSTHTFELSDEIALTGPVHVRDDDPGNNAGATAVDVDVDGDADAKVTGVVIDAPDDVAVSTDNPVTITATVHNNGPEDVTSATVNVNASVPPDCTLVPASTSEVVALPVSTATDVVLNATLHCTQPSDHTVNADADIDFNQLHVEDPDQGNNSASAATHDLEVWAESDLKISSSAPAEVLIVPGTPKDIVVDEVIHNNGPFDPADVEVSRSAAGSDADADTVDDCSAVIDPTSDVATLNVSVGTPLTATVTASWEDDKKPPYSCDITIEQSIAGPGGHIVDPVSANDSDSVTVTLVRDTDGDTVVDNYMGERDNCQDDPNPDQTDTDGDGLGDACDPNPSHDVEIACYVLLGPPAHILSDTNGSYGWLVCEASNPDPDDARVTVSVTLSDPPAGCTQDRMHVLPGQTTFILLAGESKYIVERIRLECHDPAVPQVYYLIPEMCLDMEVVDCDDDDDGSCDEDDIDGEDNDGDSLIDEDPSETGDSDCDSVARPCVIEQP